MKFELGQWVRFIESPRRVFLVIGLRDGVADLEYLEGTNPGVYMYNISVEQLQDINTV